MNLFPSFKQYKAWSIPSKLTFWGTIIGFISLVLTVFITITTDEIADAILTTKGRPVLTGSWSWELEKKYPGTYKNVIFSNQSSKEIKFLVTANLGANTCELSGFAKAKEASFVYEDEDQCIAEFTYNRKNDGISIDYNPQCSRYCGLSADFEGNYIRDFEYFVDKGVFNLIEATEFRYLTGGYYEDFVDSMQSIFLPEEGSDRSYLVYTGGVRGLYTIKEAIIIKGFGKLWAAFIDDEEVIYFTNSSRWIDKPPSEFDEWRSRFSDKKVRHISLQR